MEPSDLREAERLLAIEYRPFELPKHASGEDLHSQDAADAKHWVSVYSELVEFSRAVAARSGEVRRGGEPGLAQDPNEARLRLQSRVQELHLAYWVDRMQRLRTQSASDGSRPG